MDLYVTGGIEYNLFMLTLPKVSFGRNTCNIHLIPFENTVTCEIERLTFIDESLVPKDTWATIKEKELYKEIEDVSESIPVYYMVDYQASITAITTPYTINESEPMYIYGFVGNSEIVDGKIENVELSSLTISGPMPPNYTLKIGWYDNEGKFNKSDVIYNLTRTKICSSEISVDPNKEYIIASETNSFGIEIFEYDEQLNFIQKTYKSIHTNKPTLASNTITFTENTKYITFNLYNYGNDLTQADIVFLDASQSYDKTRIHYGVSGTHNLSGQLRGLPEVQDTQIGSVLTRRVGVRDYKEGDVNGGYMLTDGTTTLYALNPEEYKIETVIPYGIAFYGTALGCTISSNIPMGVYG